MFETMLEYSHDAIAINSILEYISELLQRVGLAGLLEALPSFGLGSLDEVDEGDDIDALTRQGTIPTVNLLPRAALFFA